MKASRFFSFGTKLSPFSVRVSFAGWDSPGDVKPNASSPQKLLTGEYGSTRFPVKFEQRSGKTFGDVLDTRSAILFLISERLKLVLEEERLSGWKAFEIAISDKTGNDIVGYHGLSIIGRSGAIELAGSEVIQKRLVPDGPLSTYYKGFSVHPDQWDGSDFFLPRSGYRILMSQRAAHVLERSNVTNLELRNLSEIEIDEYTVNLMKPAD